MKYRSKKNKNRVSKNKIAAHPDTVLWLNQQKKEKKAAALLKESGQDEVEIIPKSAPKKTFKKPDPLYGERLIKYLNYIDSNEWKGIRYALFAKRGRRCELCWSGKQLQIHHLTYARLFHEKLTDLMILCDKCHTREHTK